MSSFVFSVMGEENDIGTPGGTRTPPGLCFFVLFLFLMSCFFFFFAINDSLWFKLSFDKDT